MNRRVRDWLRQAQGEPLALRLHLQQHYRVGDAVALSDLRDMGWKIHRGPVHDCLTRLRREGVISTLSPNLLLQIVQPVPLQFDPPSMTPEERLQVVDCLAKAHGKAMTLHYAAGWWNLWVGAHCSQYRTLEETTTYMLSHLIFA